MIAARAAAAALSLPVSETVAGRLSAMLPLPGMVPRGACSDRMLGSLQPIPGFQTLYKALQLLSCTSERPLQSTAAPASLMATQPLQRFSSDTLLARLNASFRSKRHLSSLPLAQPAATEDRLAIQSLPVKAQLTDDEHPCGEGRIEWPFHAKAFYVGKELRHRVKELLETAKDSGFPRAWSKENPLICLSPRAQLSDKAAETGLPCETYIVAFDRMESVVFINGEGKEKQIWQECTGGQLTAKYTEEYRISVMPDLDEASVNAADCIVLERAEFNNIRTLSYVLAQTVALHFYETQVDRMLRKFEDMNVEMERSSSFRPAMRKEELLQMVARNNLLFTAIISKLGVMERFDVAWKNPDCNKVYEHLLEELEIEDRYENLQLKLNMVQDNFRYFLELIQNQKSDLLEWIIIILIGGEISLNLYELFMK